MTNEIVKTTAVPSNNSVSEFSRESSREASAETPAVRQQVTLTPSIKASGSPVLRSNNMICE